MVSLSDYLILSAIIFCILVHVLYVIDLGERVGKLFVF